MRDRILILLFGDLGDTLLTIPALRALRCHYPRAQITLLTKEIPAQIVRPLDLVDDVIVIDKHVYDSPGALRSPRAWLYLWKLWRRIRRFNSDTVVLYHHLVTRWGTAKFAALALASGARERIGIDNGRGWFLTSAVPDDGFGARHEAEYFMAVSNLLGADAPLRLEVMFSDADRRVAADLLPAGRFIAIHPGTGWYGPGRRWDPTRFAEAADTAARSLGAIPVIVGTGADREAADAVLNALDIAAVDLVGQTGIEQLAAVLARCAVLIANDGGVAHLAAAVGCPVVTVFGPSNDAAWRPLSGTVVAADLPCRPCFYRGFERGLPNGCATRECLSLVPAARVAAEAVALADAQRDD
ncbi:MAG TPA: glycosyltransferase family 9 protein [Chloroflexota bacterium]|nr:glycosyltransferase family 9 protein [Chloroflexota bacterium]